MLRPCLECGNLSHASRCPTHSMQGNTSWNSQRDRATQAAFRRRVLEAADHQCQAVEDGQRCTATTELQAHHIDEHTGVALCRPHHRAIDSHAR